jgi:hypothetical protein
MGTSPSVVDDYLFVRSYNEVQPLTAHDSLVSPVGYPKTSALNININLGHLHLVCKIPLLQCSCTFRFFADRGCTVRWADQSPALNMKLLFSLLHPLSARLCCVIGRSRKAVRFYSFGFERGHKHRAKHHIANKTPEYW